MFRPGQSGNPAGRKPGSKNRVNLLLDKMAAADAEDVLRALLDKAKAGDVPAAQTVLARIWPPAKGRVISLALPPIATAADVIAALSVIAAAVGGSQITPEEAQHVAAILETTRRAIETVELEQRIAALEIKHG